MTGCQTPAQLLPHSASSKGLGEKMTWKSSRVEIRTIIKKSKSCIPKQSKKRNSFTTSHQQEMSSNFLGSRAQQLFGKTNDITTKSSHHPPFPQLFFLSMTSYGMGYPFGWLGQLSELFPLPTSCPSPAYRPLKLVVGRWRESLHTAQALLSHSQNTGVSPTLAWPQCKAQHCTGCCGEG